MVLDDNSELQLRSKALTLASNCVYILLLASLVFTYLGKHLPIPDFIWGVILAPWLGALSLDTLKGFIKGNDNAK